MNPGIGFDIHSPLLTQQNVKKRYFTFSFKQWNQIENFGLKSDKIGISWFASLLEALKRYSDVKIETFLENNRFRNVARFHEVIWDQPGIPIQRHEFTWVDKNIVENNEDYPFYQLSISASSGRVIGYFDEFFCFQIVLLDPLHNICPTQHTHYKVDPCMPLSCEFKLLLSQIESLQVNNQCDQDCGNIEQLKQIKNNAIPTNAVVHFLDDLKLNEFNKVLKKFECSAADVLEAGISSLNSFKA